MDDRPDPQPDPPAPGRARGWLGSLARRLTLSMGLSVAAHLAVLAAVVLAVLYFSGAGGEALLQERHVSVSLLGADADTGDPAPAPDAPPEGDRPVQDTITEGAEDRMKDEHEARFQETLSAVQQKAENASRERITRDIRAADLASQKQLAALRNEISELQARSGLEADQAAARMAQLRKDLAAARRRAEGRRVDLAKAAHGGGEGVFEAPPADADRIVYVVDRSGSMRDKLDTVKRELNRAVEALKPNQSFHIVFYDTDPLPMAPPRLIDATRANKDKARAFVNGVTAGGGTKPRESVRLAVALRPQLVYLLTDGQFPYQVVDFIDALNADRKVVINTICFRNAGGRRVLKEIARRNGGSFTFVH